MAKTLNNAGIGEGQTIEAHHVSQSIDAFTGAEDYDISLSGSFNLTGSLIQKGGDVKFENLSNTAPGNYVAFNSSTKTLSYATTESIISANAAAISGAFDAASASIDATITALSASLTSSIGDVSASFVVTIDSVSSSLSSSIGDVTSSLTAVSAAFATTIEEISAGDDDWYSGSGFITTSRDVYIANNSLLSVGGNITGSGNLKVSGFVSASSVTASKIFIYEPNSDISDVNIIPELKFKHYDYTDFTIKNDISTSPNRSTLIISSSLGSFPYNYIAWVNIIPPTEFSASNILMPNITEGGNKFLSWDSTSGRIYYTSSTPGGGGSDNDWFDGTTYITTSKDTYITGSLIVSGSTTTFSGSKIYMPNLDEADGKIVTWNISTGKLSYTSSTAGGGGVDDDWKVMPGSYMTTSYNVEITGAFAQTGFGEVYFTDLNNDNTPHYVSYDNATGKISYESTSSIVTNVSNSLVATINDVSSSITSSIGDISASFVTTIENLELGDDDWYSGSGFITTSRDSVRITGSLIVSSSNSHSIFGESLLITVLTSSTNQTGVTISKSIAGGSALTTVGTTTVSGSFFQYAPFGGLNIKAKNPATIDLSVDGTFPASILNVTASLRLTNVTGSENGQTHNIIGDTVFTSSNFFISSSNIRFPALSQNSSDYYLAYNTSNGQIAYNLTSSIAGGGGSDNDWYEGSGFITTSNQVQITGSLIVSGSGITGSDAISALFDLFGVSRSREEQAGDVLKWDNVNQTYTNGPNVVFTGFNISSSNPIVDGTEQSLTNDGTLNIVNAISYSKTDDVVDVTIDTAFNRIAPTSFSSPYNLAITGSVVSSGSLFRTISNNFIVTSSNFYISSSDIRFPAIPTGSSDYYLAYDSSTGRIAYNLTSWYEGSGFITTSNDVIITGSLLASSSTPHLFIGEIIFAGGEDFDVRNTNIKLGNELSDNVTITGSFISSGSNFGVVANNLVITSSNFFVSSSNIRFPALPQNSSEYYLAYDSSTGTIAYNLTSSIGGSDDDWFSGSGFITTSNDVRITGSVISSGSTFEVISNDFILNNNNIIISSSTIEISSSGDQTYIADDFNVLNNTFNVKSISGNNRFGVNITGSRFITGSLRHTGTTISDISSSILTLTVSSSYYQFIRQGIPFQSGSIVLPTDLTTDETGLTFEIIYFQGVNNPTTPALKISASDDTGLVDYNLAPGEARLIKCIYNYTFDNLNIGNETGWVITAVTASL